MNIINQSDPLTVALDQDSISYRDQVITTSKGMTVVGMQEELEIAVAILRDLSEMEKKTEKVRKERKAPAIEFGKRVDRLAADFIAPVEKEKLRITGLVNNYQRKQLEEQQTKERAAREEQARAERDAALARQKIEEQEREIERQRLLAEQAKTAKARAEAEKARAAAESKLLDAELAAEEAALTQQSAQMELTVPTNNPRGLTTRVRYDFEVTQPHLFIARNSDWFKWNADTETFKLDRQRLISTLNDESGNHKWLPEETQQSVTHTFGLRVFKSVSTHVR